MRGGDKGPGGERGVVEMGRRGGRRRGGNCGGGGAVGVVGRGEVGDWGCYGRGGGREQLWWWWWRWEHEFTSDTELPHEECIQ